MCRFLCECKWINVLLLDCIVKFMLSFVRNTKLSSKVAVPFYTPTSNEWEFLLLHALTNIWCYQCPDFGCSNRCVSVSYCFVNLHSPDDIWFEAYFHLPNVFNFMVHRENPCKLSGSPLRLLVARAQVWDSGCLWSLPATWEVKASISQYTCTHFQNKAHLWGCSKLGCL